jgi:hypothetical protein
MDEILVNANPAGGRPAILGLGSGFIVVWTESGRGNLKGARFNSSGVRVGDDFQVNTTTGIFGLPAIARLRFGFGEQAGFVVAWIAFPPAKVLFQRFTDDGARKGEEIQVSATDVVADLERIREPAITSLTDGNFVVSWVAFHGDTQIRAQIFRPDGTKVGDEFRVSTSGTLNIHPGITQLPPGGLDDRAFVITWSSGDGIGRTRPHFQMFNLDGTKADGEVVPRRQGPGTTITFADGPGIDPRQFMSISVALDGGPDEENVLVARLFSPDGSELSSNITHTGDETVSSAPFVRPVPNGGAVVAWTEKKVPTTGIFGNNIMAVRLGVQGSPQNPSQNILTVLGSILRINTAPAGGQDSPSVAPIADDLGRIAFAWVDLKLEGPAQPVIKARIVSNTLLPN